MAEQAKDGFAHWAIVEIMGRQQLAGMVTEQTIAGTVLLRVDVPEVTFTEGSCYMLGKFIEYKVTIPAFTTFVGGSSIYRLTAVNTVIAKCSKCGQHTDYVEAKAMFKCPSCGHEEMPF